MEITSHIDHFDTEYVIIKYEDGSFTSMLKSTWDEQQKAAELGGTL